MANTHPFVSAIADGGDATLVRPSNWNASHIGISDSNSEPTVSDTIRAGYSALIIGLPVILDVDIVLSIEVGAVLVLQV